MITNQSFASVYEKKGLSVFPLAPDTLHRPEDGTSWENDPAYLVGLNTSPLREGDLLTTLHIGNSTIKGENCTFLVLRFSETERRCMHGFIRRYNMKRSVYDRKTFAPPCEARDGEYSLYFYLVPHSLLNWQRKNDLGIDLYYGGDRILLPSATTEGYRWVGGKEPTVDNLLSRRCVEQLSIVISFIFWNFELLDNEEDEASAGS